MAKMKFTPHPRENASAELVTTSLEESVLSVLPTLFMMLALVCADHPAESMKFSVLHRKNASVLTDIS